MAPTTDITTIECPKARRRRFRRASRIAFAGAAGAAVGVLALGGLVAVPAGATSKPTTVNAAETEFHIALSKKTFHTGRYTFVAMNKGHVTHSLEITGPGLKNPTTKNLLPGQSAELTVTFKKGAYDIFCPVPGHKMLGMNVNVVVHTTAPTSAKS